MRHVAVCAIVISFASTLGSGLVFAAESSPAPSTIAIKSPASPAVSVAAAARPFKVRLPQAAFAESGLVVPFAVSAARETNARPFRLRDRYGRGGGRNGGAAAALVIGAAAAIAGTAVLVYANRPECQTNAFASGCGYGTKVVGGAVLAGGTVGVLAGAMMWR
jgi:hypothetical protein